MKVVIGYPPLESKKGIPLLGQNRQFQWVHTPWTAYPMVPAYAAALLKEEGYQVFWLDGISSGQSYEDWEKELLKIKPDLLVIETKTPVVKKHWEIITKLQNSKTRFSTPRSSGEKTSDKSRVKLKTVLVGDHVTALPEESMQNSKVDYILTGGDYDFLLLNLVNHLTKGEKLEPGIWYRDDKEVENTGRFVLNHDLDKLPFVDRDLTKWELYAYQNTNYLRIPGTYTMFGRDCWWGKCSFCSWPANLYPRKSYRVMSPKRALDEIGYLTQNYPFKEIMDDSGTFPVGDWLREFCQGMIKRGYNKRIRISCNMRFNAGLKRKDYPLMSRAGFRFLLYGLESANQKTLDKIGKNLKIEQVEPVLRWAKEAGLYPHLTVMVGCPWEGKEDIQKTLEFTKKLFKKGLIDTLQATIVIPYPGTPLFKEAYKKGWLKTLDWSRYDMQEPILKTKMSNEELKKAVQAIYKSVFSPQFLLRKIKEAIVDWDVFKYYARLTLKFPSRLLDFRPKR